MGDPRVSMPLGVAGGNTSHRTNAILVSRATYGLYKLVPARQPATSSGVHAETVLFQSGKTSICAGHVETAFDAALSRDLQAPHTGPWLTPEGLGGPIFGPSANP